MVETESRTTEDDGLGEPAAIWNASNTTNIGYYVGQCIYALAMRPKGRQPSEASAARLRSRALS